MQLAAVVSTHAVNPLFSPCTVLHMAQTTLCSETRHTMAANSVSCFVPLTQVDMNNITR
jgi:hypothetical protein